MAKSEWHKKIDREYRKTQRELKKFWADQRAKEANEKYENHFHAFYNNGKSLHPIK